MKIKHLNWIIIAIIFVLCFGTTIYFLKIRNVYIISQYFPLNENDKYTYIHHEGIERGITTITVKNIRKTIEGKQFDWLWEGKYNDRIQTHLLTSKGMIFCRNEHLVGGEPLRSVRICNPPLVMIPSQLKKNSSFFTLFLTYSLKGKLLNKENIEANISFIGKEDIKIKAGEFKCLHFFISHDYKDILSGNSIHRHTYDLWIAPGVGIVKFIHTFVPFIYVRYFRPEEKTIMNRYNSSFVEYFELKNAIIGGKKIGQF